MLGQGCFSILIVLFHVSFVSTSIGNWTFSQDDRYSCIKISAELILILEYELENKSMSNTTITVPADETKVSGTCNYNTITGMVQGNEQIISLEFYNDWNLTFKFSNDSKLESSNMAGVYQVSLNYTMDAEHFPNVSQALIGHWSVIENEVFQTNGSGALKLFSTMNDRCYKCNTPTNTVIVGAAANFTLRTKSVQAEAFMQNKTTFSRQQICSADLQDGKSDLIPIIIGAALAALVVIVLIGYLIGRARTKRTVYETI